MTNHPTCTDCGLDHPWDTTCQDEVAARDEHDATLPGVETPPCNHAEHHLMLSESLMAELNIGTMTPETQPRWARELRTAYDVIVAAVRNHGVRP